MRVFVGYGYNDRDSWIEDHLFPILRCVGFTVVHGKGMHGLKLDAEVERRLKQSDAAIGFFTLREGQGDADFTSHIWVRDEMVYAIAGDKPVIPVREDGVKLPPGLLGNRQYIRLDPADRLACVAELITALGERKIRKVRLDPPDSLRASLWQWRNAAGFVIEYRTQNSEGLESDYRPGRLETFEQGFYLNLTEIPSRAYIDVRGVLHGEVKFGSGWVSADAVQVKIF